MRCKVYSAAWCDEDVIKASIDREISRHAKTLKP